MLAALTLALVLAGTVAVDAEAAGPGGGPIAQQGAGGNANGDGGGQEPGGRTEDPVEPAAEPNDEASSGGLGSVNPIAISNPICDGALKAGQERNCANTGSPEARFPASHYGLEIHVDTGLDNIDGNFQSVLAQIANMIWTACLFMLNLILSLVGWAFSLSPFEDSGTMREISSTLERFYRVFTSPWLVLAFVCIGAWGVYKGLIRREVGASIAGMAVSVALMICGLIVLHEPKETVGTAARFTNDAAQAVIGAPLKGSLAEPTASYAAATADTWKAMTLPGFAALNFSDVRWALSKPDRAPRVR